MTEKTMGWYEFRKINLRQRMEKSASFNESIADKIREAEEIITREGDELQIAEMERRKAVQISLKQHLIYINALKEGLLDIEHRLEKIEELLKSK